MYANRWDTCVHFACMWVLARDMHVNIHVHELRKGVVRQLIRRQ